MSFITKNLWLGAVLLYAGHRLVDVQYVDYRTCSLDFDVSEQEAEELIDLYRTNQLPLADAKSFVDSYFSIQKRIKELRTYACRSDN